MTDQQVRTPRHSQRRHRHRGADGRGARLLPLGRLRAGRRTRDQQGHAGLHRAHRCLAADHRQGKEAFDKYGITDANVAKQASWGTTRDNIVLGSGSGGIDGAHILTPKPYQISMGTTTPENKPVPMYILCRLNYDCQAISVAKEFKGLGITVDAKAFKEPSPRRRPPARK